MLSRSRSLPSPPPSGLSVPADLAFDGDPDGTALPVQGTLCRAPWTRLPTAQVLCHMRDVESKQPLWFDPRMILAGVNVVRVNFDRADPPREVIDAFKEVQSAEQERDRLQKEADAYANKVVAGARGEAAQVMEEAEGYRAQVVNQAEGEASRFSSVLAEYKKAPDVTRERLYIETMQEVMKRVDKIILDDKAGGSQGVVPFLPLNELGRAATGSGAGGTGGASTGAPSTGSTTGGSN